ARRSRPWTGRWSCGVREGIALGLFVKRVRPCVSRLPRNISQKVAPSRMLESGSEFKEVRIMRKFFILSLVCILSGLMLAACQREQGVQAGNEQGRANEQGRTGEYQPRSAPTGEAEQGQSQQGQAQQGQEMTGELQRVDMSGKTISVRVDNGMEQTFKFDDNTMVMGLEGQPQANAPSKSGKAANASIQNLVGKEGSEVTVQWRDENGAKMATHINVTQVSTSKKGKTKGTY